jgi:hypothetical protein
VVEVEPVQRDVNLKALLEHEQQADDRERIEQPGRSIDSSSRIASRISARIAITTRLLPPACA